LYSTNTSDPNNNKIFYWFDWGDDTNSGWVGPFFPLDDCILGHSWDDKGDYEIRVKAKDFHGYESEWSDPLSISIPKSKTHNLNIFELLWQRLITRFPILSEILNLQ